MDGEVMIGKINGFDIFIKYDDHNTIYFGTNYEKEFTGRCYIQLKTKIEKYYKDLQN